MANFFSKLFKGKSETPKEAAPQQPSSAPAAPAVKTASVKTPAPLVNLPSETATTVAAAPDGFAPVDDIHEASILLVDDDPDILVYLKDELEDFCKNVYTVPGPLKAIECLKKNSIDIIVSDVMMPGMDGFEFCRYVKTSVAVSHIPVILLTARSDENSKLVGYKNGADDYITKPFDVDVLKDSINRLFQKRGQARQRFLSTAEVMPASSETTFSSADEIFLQKFHSVVYDNISDPDLDIKHIVTALGMSRTLIYNKVTNLTGLNIKEYISKARIEHVINLLKTTNLPLGEIAEKSGFNSPRYFSTAFKNYTGKTPSQYKKENCM